MFADYAAINSRKQFDYGLFSKSFIFYQASANGSACLALKSFNRLVEGSDDGLSAGLAFNELDGSFNLGQHGAGCDVQTGDDAHVVGRCRDAAYDGLRHP